MKLHRLQVTSFAAIESVDIEFGPGLNVLYGPNDLGKSTVVAAIRLGLLLPHTSTHSEKYVGWTGPGDPIVEMTLETEAQKIWRVRKQFSKTGTSVLYFSRNGRDFDEVERGRKVDGSLREILRWGIPEPGGAGGVKGLPTSFLASALLSPQDDVGAVLRNSLQADSTTSGKEQIAAALEAVAQDPLFVALLRETQARRDAAYTDKGAKKTAKGSVFKAAAERLNETRDEKERLERIVFESEGTEKQLRGLADRRTQKQAAFATAVEFAQNLERLAAQAACRSVAAEQVRLAQEDLQRIQRIGTDAEESERKAEELAKKIVEAEEALNEAKGWQTEAEAALKTAEENARAEGSDSGVSDTVVRQQLELRKVAADQAVLEAQQRIDAAVAAQKLVEAASTAGSHLKDQETKAHSAIEGVSRTMARLTTAEEELRRSDVLERALDLQAADKRVAEAQATVDKQSELKGRLDKASLERAALAGRRAAITVPPHSALGFMRQLENELAAARGALDVGLKVTVTPNSRVELRVRKDGQDFDADSNLQPVDIEAKAEIEVRIGDVATVHVRGGRREAQEKAKNLEGRWSREVQPHLASAGVTDLAGLDAKSVEARELDSGIRAKDTELESLRDQAAELDGAAEALREASERAAACRAALGDIAIDSLAADLKSLGADAVAGLRNRKQQSSKQADAARTSANQAATERTLADEGVRQSKLALNAAISARDGALAAFVGGLDAALTAAWGVREAAIGEKAEVSKGFASLDREIEARKKRIDAALSGARTNAEQAAAGTETAQRDATATKMKHAAEQGRLVELRKQRDAENITAAEAQLQEAVASHAALPVPEREVSEEEVSAGRMAAAGVKAELDGIEREILEAQGALKQVGGAVARERLRDATEAFELAARQEREIEADYEAWKLLLEEMKEADAAQASNLGQALGPAIAGRFQELTRRRYETVQLTAQLATEGIMVSGVVRSTEQISVGTREQLSTLYRLSLAEYLGSTIILDDQLVQSDDNRMDWFRALLAEKARNFQILVFTCRPTDYLRASDLVPPGTTAHADFDSGFVRAVDLGRALRRR
jgi:DNA repair exonuclease SbcCD ATPase subunit